ncbi:MAG: Double zinc ribbon [Methanoregula sp. PtaU1.Bin051]|nr:MAG: Double zinc ribbon [Methanoregula sp. PtaU1.Bin051]
MIKCPHCGIEIRDTTTVCMYCGGKIQQRKGTAHLPTGKDTDAVGSRAKAPASKRAGVSSDEEDEEEEERGPSYFLESGEQILIGSLNVMVKKLYFNAYLTNKRIFLIDTAEKKLKATSKDIPLDTIKGSIVEFSENSDPVLVLSIQSAADEETRAMKLVFAGDGMDRSSEIDEWVELLNEQAEQPVKQRKPLARKAPAPVMEEEEEEPRAPLRKPEPVRQEIHPARRPVKGHEKQPPVKRLLTVDHVRPAEEEPEEERPVRRQVKYPATEEAGRKAPVQLTGYREITPGREPAKPVRKVEVHSAVKGALQGTVTTARQTADRAKAQPVPSGKPVFIEPEDEEAAPVEEEPVTAREPGGEEAAAPLFCQNCGKKLPGSANFCPGCGTKISASHEKKHMVKPHVKSINKHEEPAPAQEKPEHRPAKKAPKGSELTILHKFLRR